MTRPYTMSAKAREARRKGGLALVKKYGNEYMAELGRKGAQAFYEKYSLFPYGLNDFAIRDRQTGELVALLSGENLRAPQFSPPPPSASPHTADANSPNSPAPQEIN